MTMKEVLTNLFWAPVMVWLTQYFRRKLTADLQARIGPSLAGPWGALQGVADLTKWMSKTRTGESLAPSIDGFLRAILAAAVAAFFLLIPLSGSSALSGLTSPGDLWPFAPLAAAFMVAVVALTRGLYQRDPLMRAEALRMAGQMAPAVLAAGIIMTAISYRTGGIDWRSIVAAQAGSVLDWNAVRDPFCFLAAIFFVITGWVLFHLPPFQPRSAGIRVDEKEEFLRRFFRDFGFYGWSLLCVLMFFGGWTLGAFSPDAFWSQIAVFQLKAAALVIVSTWIQVSLPGLNQVQTTEFALRVLVPGSFLALLGVGVWMGVFQ